jgi:hypothetical protein
LAVVIEVVVKVVGNVEMVSIARWLIMRWMCRYVSSHLGGLKSKIQEEEVKR